MAKRASAVESKTPHEKRMTDWIKGKFGGIEQAARAMNLGTSTVRNVVTKEKPRKLGHETVTAFTAAGCPREWLPLRK